MPAFSAQLAQQKNLPDAASTPCPMIRHAQWLQVGASMWIAHSKLSNVCVPSPIVTVKLLSYSFPQ